MNRFVLSKGRVDIFGFRIRSGMTNTGFTIVELMIVIAVISILAGIVVTALNPNEIFKRSRDSSRLSDLQSLARSIELSIADNNTFDTDRCAPSAPCDSLSGTRNSNGSGYISINLSKYTAVLPIDPLASHSTFTDGKGNSVSASYQFVTNGNDFELRAHLESKVNTSATEGEDRYLNDGGCNANWYEVGTNLCLLP